LDLIGEGSLRGELEEQVRRQGTQELVRFCGFTADIEKAIHNSLFVVLVSEKEGQGVVTLEAAAFGRPTLLTAVHGSIDLLPPVRKLKNGAVFGHVKQLADTLEEWFSNPESAVHEGECFFEFLRMLSDPSAIAEKYEEVYQKMLEGSV
jgi:glycosyltransferase involved in cell wall biosynthesis